MFRSRRPDFAGQGVLVIAPDGAVTALEFNEFLGRMAGGEVAEDARVVGRIFTGGRRRRVGDLRLYALVRSGRVPTADLPRREPGGVLATGAEALRLLRAVERPGEADPHAALLRPALLSPLPGEIAATLLRAAATVLAHLPPEQSLRASEHGPAARPDALRPRFGTPGGPVCADAPPYATIPASPDAAPHPAPAQGPTPAPRRSPHAMSDLTPLSDPTQARTILATDCGSTTTKAILIERQASGEYRLASRGEAPTTVEAPFDDVTVGVQNSVREIEELTGRVILGEDGKPMTPARDAKTGVDLYLSTSSAGGGLQMSVAGVVKAMSAESAQRAALGAGAIIIDVIAVDDGRKEFERVERLRQLRPDMILMSGGTDGGTVSHLVEMAEMLVSADPHPRLGVGLQLPVIYAGNKDAFAQVEALIGEKVALRQVENLRPTMERENLLPAREAIHDLFLEHVMQQAPGYGKLKTWTSADIMSTPNAVGKIMETIAKQRKINVLGVDIGGATTDVFSVFQTIFNRTVSANLGMSYSICNVLTEAKVDNIKRWLPFAVSDADLRNQLRNKMIRPTTIPQRLVDLQIEQAVSREALRLAFDHHKSLARGLTGFTTEANVGKIFDSGNTGKTLVNLMTLDMIVGSGGVLSHAPRREQSALMMMDAYQPEGFTLLTVDSIFMMPHLGVLSSVHPAAATEVFERDCLIYLGTCIAPVGVGKEGEPCLTVQFGGKSEAIPCGVLRVLPLGFKSGDDGEPQSAEITVTPARNFDMGAGKGKPVTKTVQGGVSGVIIDTRGRPLLVPSDESARVARLKEWFRAMNIPVSE